MALLKTQSSARYCNFVLHKDTYAERRCLNKLSTKNTELYCWLHVQNIQINPEMFQWALRRSGKLLEEVRQTKELADLPEWLSEERQPTIEQVRIFAEETYTPFYRYFGSNIPQEKLNIDDFRVLSDEEFSKPSGDLLDVIHACVVRQEWYEALAIVDKYDQSALVAKFTTDLSPSDAAAEMVKLLDYDFASQECSLDTVYNKIAAGADKLGILVMKSEIVKDNNERVLNCKEFRGFALTGEYSRAPLVFINGNHTKKEQIFTLLHELAHISLGSTGVSSISPTPAAASKKEQWCNSVAANILIPLDKLNTTSFGKKTLATNLGHLSSKFKASTLAVLLQLKSIGYIDNDSFDNAYKTELKRSENFIEDLESARREKPKTENDLINTVIERVGHTFAVAVIRSTLQGDTLHRDAIDMLDIPTIQNFNILAGGLL